MTMSPASTRTRGGPLVMLVLTLAGWSAARVMWWENPFIPQAEAHDWTATIAKPQQTAARLRTTAPAAPPAPGAGALPIAFAALGWRPDDAPRRHRDPRRGGTQDVPQAVAAPVADTRARLADEARADPKADLIGAAAQAPFLPTPVAARSSGKAGRWSVDAWAFWRQGSSAAPVSQGRVPIYGASQAGAVLQYRLDPASPRDPRLYTRAYRALVGGGESELALGGSLRPLPRLPLRVAGEVRYTDGAASDTIRPAAYVVSALAPVQMPYGARLEAYGQAGWVGGPDPTAFADGQASLTREWRQIAGMTDDALRLSLGAAAWGGAQKDAQRIDIGPTVRFDMRLGPVPARLSIDWRARVGGDASPTSGVAATISTGF